MSGRSRRGVSVLLPTPCFATASRAVENRLTQRKGRTVVKNAGLTLPVTANLKALPPCVGWRS